MSIVIPFVNHFEWIEIAKSNGFYPTRKLLVRPVPEFDFKRVLLEFTRVKDICVEEEMTLEEGVRDSRTYTGQFQKLMKDYFIRF